MADQLSYDVRAVPEHRVRPAPRDLPERITRYLDISGVDRSTREPVVDQCVIAAGVDLVDVDRLALAIRRSGSGFVGRVLTDDERDLLGGDPGAAGLDEFAGVFGAKECAVKLMHGLPPGATLHDISVSSVPRAGEEPVELTLHGAAHEWAADRRIRVFLASTNVTDRVLLTWALATSTGSGERS